MSLFTLTATLHLAGQPTGEKDRYGNDVIGPPTAEQSPAWWEGASSTEDVDAAERFAKTYWLYLPETAPVTHADAVTLHGVRDERCELRGDPMFQPGGFVVEGYARVLVERVSG